MNCSECKNLLIEYAEGLLDAHPKEAVERHLEECPECRKEAENIRVLRDRLIKNSMDSRSIDLEVMVMDRIDRERNIRLKAARSAGFFHQIRSLFMKNTVLKIAAAAVVVFAVLIGLNFFQGGVTFARVAEPILHARTLEYDVILPRIEGIRFHDIVVEGKIRRSFQYLPMKRIFVNEGKIRRSFQNIKLDAIIDVDNSSILNLDTVHKTAAFAEAETNAEKMHLDTTRDFLRLVRGAVGEALNGAPSAVEELGRETIDGHVVFGYRLQSGTDGEEVVIWADRDTALPVEIDINLGMSYPDSLPAESAAVESEPSTPGEPTGVKLVKGPVKIAKNYTLKNIRFDVPVDESLMEMPSDYKLVDMEQFNTLMREDGIRILPTEMENSFLKILRLWSEKLSDGFFPEHLPLADFRGEFMSGFPAAMKLTPEERDELITDEVLKTVGLEPVAKEFLINLNPEEWEDFLITVSDGFRFIGNLEFNGAEWQYSGDGVQWGEGDREIFRYQMPDSSWRVVYGDLHVEDLPAENSRR
ncbi:MAG: zf-HC2 domain-containing protein [Acidobacteria bacterium]|nr:zf-HC2 domain-containing protein [Acidobacteriota bacterium]